MIGVAIFGAVLAARLGPCLDDIATSGHLPEGLTVRGLANSPEQIEALETVLQSRVRTALADTIGDVFTVTIPIALIALAVSVLLEERPLRTAAFVTRSSPGPAPRTAPERG